MSLGIPFRMRVSDYSRLEGMLHFTEDGPDAGLLLEFYHKESILNFFGSNLKTISIPVRHLSEVVHKTGWFGDKLGIRFSKLSHAEAIPGSTMGQVELKVKKKERPQLRALVVDVGLALAQHRIDELEAG